MAPKRNVPSSQPTRSSRRCAGLSPDATSGSLSTVRQQSTSSAQSIPFVQAPVTNLLQPTVQSMRIAQTVAPHLPSNVQYIFSDGVPHAVAIDDTPTTIFGSQVLVRLNLNKEPIICCVDTGADVSMIELDLLYEHYPDAASRLKKRSKTLRITGITGDEIYSHYTAIVDLYINGFVLGQRAVAKITHEIDVVEGSTCEPLIGLDILHPEYAIICPATSTMSLWSNKLEFSTTIKCYDVETNFVEQRLPPLHMAMPDQRSGSHSFIEFFPLPPEAPASACSSSVSRFDELSSTEYESTLMISESDEEESGGEYYDH